MITTHAFAHHSSGELESPEWVTEEWAVVSGIIPLDQWCEGARPYEQAANSHSAHYELEFSPWWREPNQFDFGEVRYVGEMIAWPWLHSWPHRLDDERIIITPRSDFLRYHALESGPLSRSLEGVEYSHPLDHSVVMRTWVEQVAHYNPMPFAEVQPDYLLRAGSFALVAVALELASSERHVRTEYSTPYRMKSVSDRKPFDVSRRN